MGITQGSCVIRFLQLKQEDLDQRKMKEDEDTMATLESLELKAAGPTADAGLRTVKFRISGDELDSENIQFIGKFTNRIKFILCNLTLRRCTEILSEPRKL